MLFNNTNGVANELFRSNPDILNRARSFIDTYRLYKRQAKDTFREVRDAYSTIRENIVWLNERMLEPTGIPFIDETFNAIRTDPIYKNILREVDSFYYKIDDIGNVASDADIVIEDTISRLGIILPNEEIVPSPQIRTTANIEPSMIPPEPQKPLPSVPKVPVISEPFTPNIPKAGQTGLPSSRALNQPLPRLRTTSSMFPRFNESREQNVQRWLEGIKRLDTIMSAVGPFMK